MCRSSSPALCCSLFFFSSRRRHTRLQGDWSSDVCSSDLKQDICALGKIPCLLSRPQSSLRAMVSLYPCFREITRISEAFRSQFFREMAENRRLRSLLDRSPALTYASKSLNSATTFDGSSALQIAWQTARKSAPALTRGTAFCGLIPPIATLGTSNSADHQLRMDG